MVGLVFEGHSESWASMRRTHPQFGEHCCPHALPDDVLLVFTSADVTGADAATSFDVDTNIWLARERFATMDDDGFSRNLMMVLFYQWNCWMGTCKY